MTAKTVKRPIINVDRQHTYVGFGENSRQISNKKKRSKSGLVGWDCTNILKAVLVLTGANRKNYVIFCLANGLR